MPPTIGRRPSVGHRLARASRLTGKRGPAEQAGLAARNGVQTRLDHYNLSYRVGNFLLVAARAKIIILKVPANNGLRSVAAGSGCFICLCFAWPHSFALP